MKVNNIKTWDYTNTKMKTNVEFSDEQLYLLAKRFKILSEVSRLKILRALFEHELCVTEIINATGLLQANVSKQLRILENEGIISCRPNGLMRYYKVIDNTVSVICSKMCDVEK